MIYDAVQIAEQFLYVREAPLQNTGLRVEAIQKWGGGLKGESWCCYFATMVLDICFQGNSPVPRLGACQAVYDLAKEKGWVTDSPSVGDLFLYVNSVDHAHHVGICASVSPLVGIAGNTSEDGVSSNGNGVFMHEIHSRVFVAYPR